MSKVIIEESSLSNIANSIREKNGSNSLYKPSEMSEAIDDIESVSDYFETQLTSNPPTSSPYWIVTDFLKKNPPDITISNNVTSLQYMFAYYYRTKYPKLIGGNNVTTMYRMFYNASAYGNPNLSQLITSSCTNMSAMFEASRLQGTFNLSNFNTSLVTDYNRMFYGDGSILHLDLSSFTLKMDALQIKFDNMFYQCTKLEHLDIRGFDFANFTNSLTTTYMFGGLAVTTQVPAGCEIIVKDNANKEWMNTNFPRLTNVKTVAEYEVNE